MADKLNALSCVIPLIVGQTSFVDVAAAAGESYLVVAVVELLAVGVITLPVEKLPELVLDL